jgi:hypothetical protein
MRIVRATCARRLLGLEAMVKVDMINSTVADRFRLTVLLNYYLDFGSSSS